MKIKIAISGIHGNGKTTLCNLLKDEFESYNKKVYLVEEVARNCPYSISENTTVLSQRWIWEAHIKEEIKACKFNNDVIICDRTLFDNLIYYKYLLNNNWDPIFDVLWSYTKRWMNTYDFISVLPMNPEFIIDDGVRIIDINKTIAINDLFKFYLNPYDNIDINRFNYKEIVEEINDS